MSLVINMDNLIFSNIQLKDVLATESTIKQHFQGQYHCVKSTLRGSIKL